MIFSKLTTTTCTILLLLSSVGQAEIYSWKDAEGNTVYSDQKHSSKAEKATFKDNKNVNYYSATKTIEPLPSEPENESLDTLATLEAVEEDEGTDENKTLTEADCQQQYRRSCDQVVNWEKFAREACGSDPRCNDPAFLDRKYRPRTTEELREVARRAAVRNNNIDDKIDDYLKTKFTNHCENQAELYCRQHSSRQCLASAIAQCEDPRSLREVLAKYDNLSPSEKREIIEKAKKMALANGQDALDYDQLIVSLVDILITSTLMGL